MAVSTVVPGVHQISLGAVNAYLLESPDGLTLIDAGFPNNEKAILKAVESLGRQASDVRHIFLTHCHIDHAGSAAALKRATGAEVLMHPTDAALVSRGEFLRPLTPAPGFVNAIVGRLTVWLAPKKMEPCVVDQELHDGQELSTVNGLRVVHVPGHCEGQVALLWPQSGGVLFAADSCASAFGLALSPAYEDLEAGRRSLKKLASLEFEHACFGHGGPLRGGAAEKFRKLWG
ncbi:MAG TPA: MBL fold metallo-hydrolase [Pirellulales bacterium]